MLAQRQVGPSPETKGADALDPLPRSQNIDIKSTSWAISRSTGVPERSGCCGLNLAPGRGRVLEVEYKDFQIERGAKAHCS